MRDRRVHHRQGAAAPVRQIAENAGVDGSVVFEKIKNSRKVGFGYNAYSATYCDMIPAGIVDPTKVTRTALENAASIGACVLTTESIVADKPIPQPTPQQLPQPMQAAWAACIDPHQLNREIPDGSPSGIFMSRRLFFCGEEAQQRGNFAGRGGISGELRARLKNFFSDSPTASLHSGDTLCYTVKKLDFSCDKEADVCFAS